MSPVRKRRVFVLCFIACVVALVVTLVLYALRQNISLFYTPTQIASGTVSKQQTIRAGGMVVPGSIVRDSHDLLVQFKLTDYQHTINVVYRGILPDLFREGQGVVVQGRLLDSQRIQAVQVLAKHDENYMPPEVKQALKNASSH